MDKTTLVGHLFKIYTGTIQEAVLTSVLLSSIVIRNSDFGIAKIFLTVGQQWSYQKDLNYI